MCADLATAFGTTYDPVLEFAPPLTQAATGAGAAPEARPSGGFGGMDTRGILKQMLTGMLRDQTQEQAPAAQPSGGFDWRYMIPGYAEGRAERQQMDAHQAEIKLRQQAIKGQEAARKIQIAQTLQKYEQQEKLQQLGPLLEAAQSEHPAIARAAKAQITQLLAEGGHTEMLGKWLEQQQGEREAQQFFGGAQAPAPSPGAPPAAAPAPSTGGRLAAPPFAPQRQAPTPEVPAVMPESGGAHAGAPTTPLPPTQSLLPPAGGGREGGTSAPAPAAGMAPGLDLSQVPAQVKLAAYREWVNKKPEQAMNLLAPYIPGTKPYAERVKAGREAQTPNYGFGHLVDALIYSEFGDEKGIDGRLIRDGGRPTPAMAKRALVIQQQREVEKARETQSAGLGILAQKTLEAALAKPLEVTEREKLNTLSQGMDYLHAIATEFTPAERASFVGLGGLRLKANQVQQLLDDATTGKADPKFARFAAIISAAKTEAFERGGKNLTQIEKDIVFGYVPTGEEMSAEAFEQKLKLGQERLPKFIDRELALVKTPRGKVTREMLQGTGTPTPIPSTGQGKSVKDMSTEDLLKELGKGR